MSLQRLTNRIPAALMRLRHAGSGSQQQSAHSSSLFELLSDALKLTNKRKFSQVFHPSRLYPKQRSDSEAAAFWGVVGLNVASTFLAKSDRPELQEFVSQHFKASITTMAEGRWYTLLTSSVCHTSAVHCAVNLFMLALYRRMQPLTATEFLMLYLLGAVGGSATHLAYYWYDAGGPEFGLKYAANTPGSVGCSGAVAAITAYKATLQPMGLPRQGFFVPLPIAIVGFLYCCLYIREKDYADYVGKFGAAGVGVLAAVISVARGKRALAWR